MPFSAKPGGKASARDWAAGAPVGAGKAAAKAPASAPPPRTRNRTRQRPLRPWLAYDPNAQPSKAFNLRLNDYELELLRAVADSEFCSQQALVKRILVRALEQAADELP